MGEIGFPTVINLKVEENEVVKRHRKKAEADLTAEISEEESQKVKEIAEKHNQWVEKLNEVYSDAVIYNMDYNQNIILA